MDVVEQDDVVAALRRLKNFEQPELLDNDVRVEAALDGLRQRLEKNPLLRYSDLFTLRFSVVGADGKSHHYDDFKQVESHGTSITIKVLFSLLVLRDLLREGASKTALCQVPFFLDEIFALDPTNRHAVFAMARQLGFIAITAAQLAVREVDSRYFLQPDKEGRIVLRSRHRMDVEPKAVGT